MIKACIRKTRPIYLKSIRYKVNVAPEQLYELIAQRNSIYLSPGFQEIFRELRNDQIISPYRQTQSKKVSVFVAIHWKWDPLSILRKFIELTSKHWPDQIFLLFPRKLQSKDMTKENQSEKLIWNVCLSINSFPELYFCLLESFSIEDLVRGKRAC